MPAAAVVPVEAMATTIASRAQPKPRALDRLLSAHSRVNDDVPMPMWLINEVAPQITGPDGRSAGFGFQVKAACVGAMNLAFPFLGCMGFVPSILDPRNTRGLVFITLPRVVGKGGTLERLGIATAKISRKQATELKQMRKADRRGNFFGVAILVALICMFMVSEAVPRLRAGDYGFFTLGPILAAVSFLPLTYVMTPLQLAYNQSMKTAAFLAIDAIHDVLDGLQEVAELGRKLDLRQTAQRDGLTGMGLGGAPMLWLDGNSDEAAKKKAKLREEAWQARRTAAAKWETAWHTLVATPTTHLANVTMPVLEEGFAFVLCCTVCVQSLTAAAMFLMAVDANTMDLMANKIGDPRGAGETGFAFVLMRTAMSFFTVMSLAECGAALYDMMRVCDSCIHLEDGLNAFRLDHLHLHGYIEPLEVGLRNLNHKKGLGFAIANTLIDSETLYLLAAKVGTVASILAPGLVVALNIDVILPAGAATAVADDVVSSVYCGSASAADLPAANAAALAILASSVLGIPGRNLSTAVGNTTVRVCVLD